MGSLMQVSNTIIILVAEFCTLLMVAAVLLTVYVSKLKTLIKRQQEKLLEKLPEKSSEKLSMQPTVVAYDPVIGYKKYLGELIAVTSAQYAMIAPNSEIGLAQVADSSLFQRTLALRYAFLRAEELVTSEPVDSSEYWTTLQQALEPLLSSPDRLH
jgi:hypothetical protein